jgi:hypothetical protein
MCSSHTIDDATHTNKLAPSVRFALASVEILSV